MGYRHQDEDLHQEPFDEWTCYTCFKTISSSRPPVYNPTYCSCPTVITSNGDADLHSRMQQLAEAMGTLNTHLSMYRHAPIPISVPRKTYLYHQAPTASSTYSNTSVRAPEGPERRDPSIAFLPLAPENGWGVDAHQRSASLDQMGEELGYGLRCYLESLSPPERSYRSMDGLEMAGEKWLRQDTYIGGGGVYTGRATSVRAVSGSGNESGESTSQVRTPGPGQRNQDIEVKGSGDWTKGDVHEDWPYTLMIDDSPLEIEEEEDDEEEYE